MLTATEWKLAGVDGHREGQRMRRTRGAGGAWNSNGLRSPRVITYRAQVSVCCVQFLTRRTANEKSEPTDALSTEIT